MNKIIVGFEGDNNSAKLILDKITTNYKKIYLKNNMRLSVNQVKKEINENILIIAIGQRPNIKNKIDIECQAKLNESIIVNTIDMTKIKKIIQPNYDVDISNNAGTSYCNNLYYHILKYCSKSNNRIIFLHIPYIQNISEFNKLVVTLEELIDNIDNAI